MLQRIRIDSFNVATVTVADQLCFELFSEIIDQLLIQEKLLLRDVKQKASMRNIFTPKYKF